MAHDAGWECGCRAGPIDSVPSCIMHVVDSDPIRHLFREAGSDRIFSSAACYCFGTSKAGMATYYRSPMADLGDQWMEAVAGEMDIGRSYTMREFAQMANPLKPHRLGGLHMHETLLNDYRGNGLLELSGWKPITSVRLQQDNLPASVFLRHLERAEEKLRAAGPQPQRALVRAAAAEARANELQLRLERATMAGRVAVNANLPAGIGRLIGQLAI